ncbi:MAG: hypothetical protein ABIR66_05250, partial [Saprospiraceae bacterium]
DIPGLYAQYVHGLTIRNFKLIWPTDLPSFYTHGIQCEQVKDLYIDGYSGGANPNAAGGKKILLKNSTYEKRMTIDD